MKIHNIIKKLSKYENVSPETLEEYIKSFQKLIRKEIKQYDDRSGLEDYKMKKDDYNILLKIYENTKESKYKIEIILYYIYSYYKLDGISFNSDYFPSKQFFNFIKKNTNMHTIILKFISYN